MSLILLFYHNKVQLLLDTMLLSKMPSVVVGVGSTNPTKVQASKVVFSFQFLGNEENNNGRRIPKKFDEIHIHSLEIESIVSSTPQSDNECCIGAVHRAKVFPLHYFPRLLRLIEIIRWLWRMHLPRK